MRSNDITAWRNSLGLNRTQAAKHLGISRRALFNYESGVRPIPRAIELACMAPKEA